MVLLEISICIVDTFILISLIIQIFLCIRDSNWYVAFMFENCNKNKRKCNINYLINDKKITEENTHLYKFSAFSLLITKIFKIRNKYYIKRAFL